MQPDNEHNQTTPSSNPRESEAVRILSDVESRLHSLKAMHEDQREKESLLSQREEQVALTEQQIAETKQKLEQERTRLDERSIALTTLQDEVNRQQESLDAKDREVQSRREQASEKLEAANQLEQQLAEKERQLAQMNERQAGFDQALHEQAARTEDAQQLAAQRSEELLRVQDQISESSNESQAIQRQLEESAQRESQLQDQIASLQQHLSSNKTNERELDELKQKLAEVQEKPASSQADREQIQSLEADLERAMNGIAQLKERYEAKLAEAAHEAESLNARLARANAESEGAAERIAELERSQARAKTQATAPVTAHMQTHLARRRARLGAVRVVLHKRRKQIAAAIVKLKERQVECERVLKQRSDVERARKELRTKRRQADQLINRYKGARFAMYLMVAFVLMLGMSWGVASQVVEATYMSSATLVAQNKDRELERYELEEWQAYHEPLLDDPQFHALASERFRRRGLATLGSPAAVAELVNSSVHYRSNRPGELTIELTAVGKERSELELNTLVTSARTYAEAARAQRTDGAATIIARDAKASDGPLEDQRPMYAGGIFMGGLLLMFGIGLPAWKRLSAASSAFEEQEKANEVGAEADWVEPEMLAKK